MPDETSTTFYYPGHSSFEPDGTLVVRASGYVSDSHWSGARRVPPDDADYTLWCHLRNSYRVAQPGRRPYISDDDLPAIRQIFEHNRDNNAQVA
jgi:hypothetical protein